MTAANNYWLGDLIFSGIRAVPPLHRWLNKHFISAFTDDGPLPGAYTTQGDGETSLHELLDKSYFALLVPKPTAKALADLPPTDQLLPLFERQGSPKTSRVSLLLPFFAQHLTDAVFQSKNRYQTNAPHEIILNQIYGNTKTDEMILRSGVDGKLTTRVLPPDQGSGEFPDQLCEQTDSGWKIKDQYLRLSYLDEDRIERLLKTYQGREEELGAVGLMQGNLTLSNFALTTLLMREHNRLCAGVIAELKAKGVDDTDAQAFDELVFKKAQQINITTYMKLVVEDYINTFAGQKMFKFDTTSFFYEKKRWCRETPIPYHFNILYRLHNMMPDRLNGFEDQGFAIFLANNGVVMKQGLGKVLEVASAQAAGALTLGNTHADLLHTEKAMLDKGREVLGSFDAHRKAVDPESTLNFDTFAPEFRERLRSIYGSDVSKVDYAVGIFAEQVQTGWIEKLGLKRPSIMGATLMGAIAKHAFRHIFSNRLMSKEFLNPERMTEYGWSNLQNTRSVAQLVKRNLPEMDQAAVDRLRISFDAP